MPGNPSAITTTRTVDAALVQNANYRFDANDRQYIDTQIRGCEQHLAFSLINGTVATWVLLDTSSVAISVGDSVCLASSTIGVPTVTKAVIAALSVAGSVFGVALAAGSPGSSIPVAVFGVVSPTITGLGPTSGVVTVNQSTARAQRAAAFTTGDYSLGTVDAQGYLTLLPRSPFLSAASSLIDDGTGNATISSPKTTWGTSPTSGIISMIPLAPIATANATLTTLLTYPIPASTMVDFLITITAIRTGGTAGSAGDCYRVDLPVTYQRIGAAAPSLVGSAASATGAKSVGAGSTYAGSVAISGNNLLVQATGIANTNIDWSAVIQGQQVG